MVTLRVGCLIPSPDLPGGEAPDSAAGCPVGGPQHAQAAHVLRTRSGTPPRKQVPLPPGVLMTWRSSRDSENRVPSPARPFSVGEGQGEGRQPAPGIFEREGVAGLHPRAAAPRTGGAVRTAGLRAPPRPSDGARPCLALSCIVSLGLAAPPAGWSSTPPGYRRPSPGKVIPANATANSRTPRKGHYRW